MSTTYRLCYASIFVNARCTISMSNITVVAAKKNISFSSLLKELWAYRDLIWAFAARDLKIKYFQTMFGPLWVVFTPLITVGVMTFVFGLLIKVPSEGLPYLIFYLVAIVPWYSFVSLLNQTISSLESHAGLINKIYFPRMVIPSAYAINTSVDFLVGYLVTLGFIFYFSLPVLQFILLTPLLLLIQIGWAMGLGLLLSPYNARFRDIKHAIPLFVQLYYFANPVMYSPSLAPAWANWLYKLNPFAVVISTYRATLNGSGPNWNILAYATAASIGVFVLGSLVFMKKSQSLSDVL